MNENKTVLSTEIPEALRGYDPAKVLAAIERRVAKGEGKNAAFNVWMRVVDRLVSGKYGLGVYDLEDRPYYDYFDDGLTPREVFDIISEEIGF